MRRYKNNSGSRPPDGSPYRFWPKHGTFLTWGHIRGPWRPSGAVAGGGMFAVVWSTGHGDYWAPLHDFDPATREELISECAQGDREAGYPGSHPWGR